VQPSFWVDVLCKNQWVVNSADTAVELRHCVERARPLENVPPVLCVAAGLPPADQMAAKVASAIGYPLSRVWCLFEIHTAIQLHVEIFWHLSAAAQARFEASVEAGELLDPHFHRENGEVVDLLCSDEEEDQRLRWDGEGVVGRGRGLIGRAIDIRTAQATVPADYAMVMNEVAKAPVEVAPTIGGGTAQTSEQTGIVLPAAALMLTGVPSGGMKLPKWMGGKGGIELVNAKVAWSVEDSLFDWVLPSDESDDSDESEERYF